MVRLANAEIKNDILTACRTAKPSGLFVNENLTPLRASILYTLRQIKKRRPDKIEFCGSREGRVFCWIKPTNDHGKNRKLFINTLDSFKGYFYKYLRVRTEGP